MKKFLILLLAFPFVVNAQVDSIVSYTGAMGEGLTISMTLRFERDSVLGFYLYEHVGTKIPLAGVKKDKRWQINEFPNVESYYGFISGFEGQLKGSQFTGEWKNERGDKVLPFSVDKVHRESSQVEDYTYHTAYNAGENVDGLVLTGITAEVYYFYIYTASEQGCVGELHGIVEFDRDNQSTYSVPECTVQFFRTEESIRVGEESCGLHGMRCPFYGEYFLKK